MAATELITGELSVTDGGTSATRMPLTEPAEDCDECDVSLYIGATFEVAEGGMSPGGGRTTLGGELDAWGHRKNIVGTNQG